MLFQVCVYFNNRLYRGNRCSKLDSGSFDAFWSPNLEPLAKLEINIKGIPHATFVSPFVKLLYPGPYYYLIRTLSVARKYFFKVF